MAGIGEFSDAFLVVASQVRFSSSPSGSICRGDNASDTRGFQTGKNFNAISHQSLLNHLPANPLAHTDPRARFPTLSLRKKF